MNKKPLLLGFTGKKQAGKNYIANKVSDILTKQGYTSVIEIAFADALKNEVCHAVGITRETLETNKEVFRPLLQWWGTEFRRNMFKETYWVDKVRERLKQDSKKNCAILITDVRFENEARLIEDFGGKLWRVVNPDESLISKANIFSMSTYTHASETAIDNYPVSQTVLNSRSVPAQTLHDNLEKMLANVF